MKTRQNKLKSYLAVTAGVSCVSSASAVTNVTTFIGDSAETLIPTIGAGAYGEPGSYGVFSSGSTVFGIMDEGGIDDILSFSQGDDLSPLSSSTFGYFYFYGGGYTEGAVFGDQNFIQISFDGDDVFEAVGQFEFDGSDDSNLIQRLVAVAINDDNSALSISAGVTAINAVPEPSSLALLALGATGLLSRRNRKQAA